MSQFPRHTIDTAPAESRPLLQSAHDKLGFVPNLYAHLAESPAALKAYFSLSGHFDATSLDPVERQVVLLAASVENRCEFCVAAHSMLALEVAKAPQPVVDALRKGDAVDDPRLHALAELTRSVVRERGWVPGPALDAFLAAGYTSQQAIEVVLGVAMKTLSNYTNHLTGTRTNPELAGHQWQAPQA